MIDGSGVSNPFFFIGIVEGNNDETHEGRVRVRAFGVHGTNKEIATTDLPWAMCASGNYDPNNPPPPLNSYVYGMFLDGRMAQHPIILGLLPSMYNTESNPTKDGEGVIAEKDGDLLARGYSPNDFNAGGGPDRLARGELLNETYLLQQAANRVHDQKIADMDETWSEPPPAYAAKYPHNRVIKTSKHSIEIDDSPGAERIQITHDSGAYIQIDSKGTVSERAEADRYEINIGTKHESSGHSVVTINGNSHVYVKGNKTEEVEGDYKLLVHGHTEIASGASLNINGSDQVNLRGAEVKLEANAGIMTLFGKKEIQFESVNQLNFVAKNIKNTALNTYDVFSTKAIKLSTPGDIHNAASNIINLASGLIPPTLLTGTSVPSPGWSLTTPAMQIASITTSHTGVFNTTAINSGAITSSSVVNSPSVIATSVAATRGDFTTIGAPLPSGPVSYNGGYSVPVASVSIPTVPVLLPPAVSAPVVAPLPGITSGWAYPTGNSPEFIAKVLNPVNAFLAVIADFTPIGLGAWGMNQIKMPEPPKKSTSIVPRGYFAMGYSGGYISALDDSAKDQTKSLTRRGLR
tara:strand:- start:248 stop:1978 length:1731 start_codon:yes stop_codon:yes gene_type:complete